MSNVVQRLLIFFLGVPAVAALIVFLPAYKHLAAVAVTLLVLAFCAAELASLFRTRAVAVSTAESVPLALFFPVGAYIACLTNETFPLSDAAVLSLCAAASLFIFGKAAFASAEKIPFIIPKVSALAFDLGYLGMLGSFIVLIAAEPPRSTEALLTYCLLCFANDGCAWLVGMTLGRRRGIIAVSPNKSLAGFIGGMAGSVIMAFVCSAVFPAALPAPWWAVLILGLAVGVSVIVGDLFESALKRSAGAKDSGTAVPGRGGFLDSFDSLLFASPVFYALSLILGLFR
jgi:phosphatidate cytidylyltransferase